jgi:hypothetical protein
MSKGRISPPADAVPLKGSPAAAGVTPESVKEELERILNSPAFAQSQRISRFLRFVVEEVLKNGPDDIKEYSLGVTVFDRPPDYDPRIDSIVRVEAGRVRTKLKEYYDNEGQCDPVVIELPKGSYIPSITTREALRQRAGKRLPAVGSGKRLLILASALALLCAAWAAHVSYQNARMRKELEAARRPVLTTDLTTFWGPFLSPGVQTHVVFGSPFFFFSPAHRLFLRPYDIKDAQGSEADPIFRRLQERFGPIIPTPRYDYVLEGDSLALQRLTDFLVRSGVSVKPMPAHTTTWDAIQSGNIILLGPPRLNHLLSHFPRDLDFEWESETNLRNRNPQPGEQEIYTGMGPQGYSTVPRDPREHLHDYAVVGLFPGLRPNSEILVISAHGGPGVSEAVQYLTRRETLRLLLGHLKLQDSGRRQYFQLLLRVYVDRGIPVRTEYVTHHTAASPLSE